MALFIPAAPKAVRQIEEEKKAPSSEGARVDESPKLSIFENLSLRVVLEDPQSASKAFHISARLLESDYGKNPIDFEITLLGITRIMNSDTITPRWEYLYNFVAVER